MPRSVLRSDWRFEGKEALPAETAKLNLILKRAVFALRGVGGGGVGGGDKGSGEGGGDGGGDKGGGDGGGGEGDWLT